MKFDRVLTEVKLFTNWTGKNSNEYSPDWTEYAHADLKNVHVKDYKETLKSKGKKPYLSWVNKIKVKI